MVKRSNAIIFLFSILAFAVSYSYAETGPAGSDENRREVIQFKSGSDKATLNGSVKGYGYVDYVLSAKAGQELQVIFKPKNLSANFIVFSPAGDNLELTGPNEDDAYSSKLPSSGDYVVRALLMRNAARRSEKSDYTITFQIK